MQWLVHLFGNDVLHYVHYTSAINGKGSTVRQRLAHLSVVIMIMLVLGPGQRSEERR